MRVLVTGASGFIGKEVVAELVATGHTVTALLRKVPDSKGSLPFRVALGDLADSASLAAAVPGHDAVIHLACLLKVPWKPEFRSVNIGGTRALAEACAAQATPPKLVVVSSLAAAGPSLLGPHTEAGADAPVSLYGRMKRDCEAAALALSARAPVTIVRPPMVFGAGDRWALAIFKSVVRGIHVTPTWTAHRLSLIHATDLAQALVKAAERGQTAAPDDPRRGLYYTAARERPTYAELGLWVAQAARVPPPRLVRLPSAITWIAAVFGELVARIGDSPTVLNRDKWREANAGSWTCDPTKAEADLRLDCAPTSVRLAETAAGYRAVGWLRSG